MQPGLVTCVRAPGAPMDKRSVNQVHTRLLIGYMHSTTRKPIIIPTANRDLYAFPIGATLLQYYSTLRISVNLLRQLRGCTHPQIYSSLRTIHQSTGVTRAIPLGINLVLDWSTETIPQPTDLQLIVLVSSRLDQAQFLGLMRLGPITNKLRKIPTELDGHEQSTTCIINKDASSQSQCSGEFCSHYERDCKIDTRPHFGWAQ